MLHRQVLTLGSGYNSLSSAAKDISIDLSNRDNITVTTLNALDYDSFTFENAYQLNKKFELSVEGSGTTDIISPSINASFTRALEIDSSYIYLLLVINKVVDAKRINSVKFNDRAITSLSKGADSRKFLSLRDFYEIFGDHFVKEVRTGHQIFALITLNRGILSAARNVELGAGIKGADVAKINAKIQSDIERIRRESTVEIRIRSTGLKSAMPIVTKDVDVLDSSFAKFYDVSNFSEPGPIGYEFMSYSNAFKEQLSLLDLSDPNYTAKDNLISNSKLAFDTAFKEANNRMKNIDLLKHRIQQQKETQIFLNRAKILIQGNSGPTLNDDIINNPHTSRLDYLYRRLDLLDTYLTEAKKLLLKNIFLEDDTEARFKNRKGYDNSMRSNGPIEVLLNNIQSEIKRIGTKALIYVRTQSNGDKYHPHFTLYVPRGTKYLWFSIRLLGVRLSPQRWPEPDLAKAYVPLAAEELMAGDNPVDPPVPVSSWNLGWGAAATNNITVEFRVKGKVTHRLFKAKKNEQRANINLTSYNYDYAKCSFKVNNLPVGGMHTLHIYAERREIDLGFYPLPFNQDIIDIIYTPKKQAKNKKGYLPSLNLFRKSKADSESNGLRHNNTAGHAPIP